MNHIFFIIILLSICVKSISSTIQVQIDNDTICSQIQHINERFDYCEKQGIDIEAINVLINSIGTHLTWSGIIIAIISLLVTGVVYHVFIISKHEIKRNEKRFNDKFKQINTDLELYLNGNDKIITEKIREIREKERIFDECISKLETISKTLKSQEEYIKNSNLFIYAALDDIANKIPDKEDGKRILKKLLHKYHVTNLYSTDSKFKFASLAYLENNGTHDDLPHLEYVSKNDADKKNSKWAGEIIGIIRYKSV